MGGTSNRPARCTSTRPAGWTTIGVSGCCLTVIALCDNALRWRDAMRAFLHWALATRYEPSFTESPMRSISLLPRIVRVTVALSIAAAGACSESPVAPAATTFDGTWTLSVSHLPDSKVSCEVSPFTVALTTSATRVTGTSDATAGSHTECTVIGGTPPYSTPFYPTGALSGEVSGSTVSLVLDDGSWSFAGARSGDVITGTATYRGTDDAGPVERSGAFTLRRVGR